MGALNEDFLVDPSMDEDEGLDAYGHLTWTVNTVDDPPDGGEWMACFDAVYCEEDNRIYYEVVVDGGSFVDTPDTGSVLACDRSAVEGLKHLPSYWIGVGSETGETMDYEALPEVERSWSAHIDSLAARAISEEEMEAVYEQQRQEREQRP